MARRNKSGFSGLQGENATHEKLGLVRIVEPSRVAGVHGATVRPLDKEFSQVPGGGMRWVPMRELSPAPGGLRGVVRAATPSGAARLAGNKPWSVRDTDRDKLIIELRKQGLKLETIAEAFGISHQRVSQVIGSSVSGAEAREARKIEKPKKEPLLEKHGKADTPEYRCWNNMLQRCFNPNNPNYPHYGGRGITVCDRWLWFSNFYKDMGERPEELTLDRKENDGNYEPGNCRWATPTEQAQNRRKRNSATKSTDLQGEEKIQPNPLHNERGRATVRLRRKRSNQPTTTQRRTNMATATTGRKRGRTKAAEAEPETKTKGRGRKTAAKAEVKETNGNGRRTHDDIMELVPEIVEKLQDGTTMTEIRAEYGAGPVIRKALTEAGYNTKGEKIEVDDISDLKGQRLAKAIANLREEGRAWYYIELAADLNEADAKALLEEHGYSELASGRVSTAAEEEEEAPKPTGRKRGRGAAKAEEAEKPKATRGRGRRKGNPSSEG